MIRVLLLFVDGVGLGPDDPTVNPLCDAVCPTLTALLRDAAWPIDAHLGVPGLPQSATGQTAMLTGINAPARMQRHVEGFPGPELRRIVASDNIFKQLLAAGKSSTFANGYLADDIRQVQAGRRKSVTTVAALSAFGMVRLQADLLARRAVCHDLTRELLVPRGYTGPLLTPAEAADDLAGIAAGQAFTLFEFFLTDHAGHSGDMRAAQLVLSRFDRFLMRLLERCRAAPITLLLTSDHGNIEDMRSRTHTAHAVPFAAVGPGAARLRGQVQDLTGITPAIVGLLTAERQEK
jgi:2,3-bisphosphoglycerate-independent phosphoglycerate mutase